MSLRGSYTVLAPVYDLLIGPLLGRARRRSIQRLPQGSGLEIFLDGVGSGLDLPLLPPGHRYTALDLTPAMLRRAQRRQGRLHLAWVQGDSQQLPFADASFDHALLHLILAVVPDTVAALREAARVLRPGGRLYVLDKFLARGAAAPLRRLLNPLARRIATRTDVVFEDALARVAGLSVVSDEAALAGGWFRLITLEKLAPLETREQAAAQPGPDAPGPDAPGPDAPGPDGPGPSASSSSLRGQLHQTKPSSSASAAATSIRNQVNPLIDAIRLSHAAHACRAL